MNLSVTVQVVPLLLYQDLELGQAEHALLLIIIGPDLQPRHLASHVAVWQATRPGDRASALAADIEKLKLAS